MKTMVTGHLPGAPDPTGRGKRLGSSAAREAEWVLVYHMTPSPLGYHAFWTPLATLSQELVKDLPISVMP